MVVWIPPLPLKICLKDTFFHISINSLGLYLSAECLLNVLSKMHIPPCVGKIFKFMAFTFLEIALNLGITSAPTPPHSKLSPKFLSSLGKGNYSFPRAELEQFIWLNSRNGRGESYNGSSWGSLVLNQLFYSGIFITYPRLLCPA